MSTPQAVTDALADFSTKKAAFDAAQATLFALAAAAETAVASYNDAIQAATDARAAAIAPYFAAQEYQDAISAYAATNALLESATATAQTAVASLDYGL